MKFQQTLQQRYKKHLNTPIISENLDQEEIDKLINIAKEVREIMDSTNYKVDVLRFLFDHIMEETERCGKCIGVEYEEDEQTMGGQFALTPNEVNAINTAYTMAQGQAKGGLLSTLTGGALGNPVKKIQKAYGEVLTALSQRLVNAANKMKQGGV